MLYASVFFLILAHSCLGAPDPRRLPHAIPDLRIINGRDAAPHAAPYYAHVVITMNGKMYYCGGSLIQNQYVLTAAHCLADPSVKVASVSAGLYSSRQTDPVQRVGGAVFRYHEDYPKDNASHHDVAIIKLDSPVNITVGSVETVQLPNSAAFPARQAAYDNLGVTLYGWGRTRQSPKVVPDALQTLDGRVVPHDRCQTMAYVNQDELCVGRLDGTPGVACQGDSGGPLLQAGVLIGVHSHRSSQMCSASYVGIYARVDYNMDWIRKTIRALETV